MMNKPKKFWQIIILGLVALGGFRLLLLQPLTVILFITVFGGIWYLYKYPPRWLLRFTSPYHNTRTIKPKPKARSQKSNVYAKKRRSFRVIDGNKKRSAENTKPSS